MLKVDINLVFTIINLLVLFVAMRIFFFKPIKKIIDDRQAEADSFWYFTPNELSEDAISEQEYNGYHVTDYGQMQLSQYPFFLYYMEK